LFEHLGVELLDLLGGHTLYNAVALADSGIVKRLGVVGRYLLVTGSAGRDVIRGPFDHPFMGLLPGCGPVIAPVARGATRLEVGIRPDQPLVDQIPTVHLLCLNRRRRPRSPLPSARGYDRRFVKRFQQLRIGVTRNAAAGGGKWRGKGKYQKDGE